MSRPRDTPSVKRRTSVIDEPKALAPWAASLRARVHEAFGSNEMGQRTLDLLSSSLISHTLQSYAGKLSQFAKFCHDSENISPLLEATPAPVVRYVAWIGRERPRTGKRQAGAHAGCALTQSGGMAEGALTGLRVLCTGLATDTAACQRAVAQLGGDVQPIFLPERPPHVLVARDVTTEKYRAAVNAVAKVPIVLPDWVQACKEAGRQVPFDGYRVGPFAGLKITVTGMTIPERAAVSELVTKGGGVSVPMLTRDCTHLVCVSPCDPSSKKYKMALSWKVPTVTRQWVQDSANQGAMQDEQRYPVMLAGPRAASGPSRHTPSASLQIPPPAHSQAAAPEAKPTLRSGSAPPRQQAATSATESSRPATVATDGAALEADHAGGLYLDGVRLALCCCSAAEAAEMARLGREAGATREPELSPRVTHVVLGSEQDSAALGALREHLRRYGEHAALVGPEWLRGCAAAGSKLAAAGDFLVPLSRLQVTKAQAPQAAGQEGSSRNRDLRHGSNSCPAWPHSGSQSQRRPPPLVRPPAPAVGVLEGLRFTLAALDGHEAAAQRAAALVQEDGGAIVGPEFRGPPEVKVYAVCPFGFPAEQQRLVEQRSAVFRQVDKNRRVTLHWLEMVHKRQELFSGSVSTAFQPLPHELPMKWMEGIKVCASGYEEDERTIIKMMTKDLGGKYSQTMGRSNTHLVLPVATGDKYRHRDSMGVIPVTSEWLIASAVKGMRMPESHYPPKPAPPEAVDADTAAAADPAVPSQVCTTQMPPQAAHPAAAHRPQAQTRMGRGAAAALNLSQPPSLSQSSQGTGNPTFLDRLLQSHKVDKSEVAHRSPPEEGRPSPAAPAPAAAAAPVPAAAAAAAAAPPRRRRGLQSLLDELDATDPARSTSPGRGASPAKAGPKEEALHDDTADMLAKIDKVMDGLKDSSPQEFSQALSFGPAGLGGSSNLANPSDSGAALEGRPPRRGGNKRKAATNAAASRSRSRRVRGMPPPDASRSNPDGDFLASQMDGDMQVVYQESEKTAAALQRVSGKRRAGHRAGSAREFLNRAVLSGIENNGGGGDKAADELKELGLL
eukprot:jgi/Tetstr1/423574/TSEL_014246.t1